MRAFTLVELIVVITILAILWTIAFISLQWYSRDARDSVRVTDLNNIKKSAELIRIKRWKYPYPDNNVTLKMWTNTLVVDWEIWSNLKSNLWISGKVKDPLYNTPYRYLTNWNEFLVMSSLENQNSNFQIWKWYIINPNNSISKTPLYSEKSWTIDILTDTGFINWTYKLYYWNNIEFSTYRKVWDISVIEWIDSTVNYASDDTCNKVIYFTKWYSSKIWMWCNMWASQTYKIPGEIVWWNDYYEYSGYWGYHFSDDKLNSWNTWTLSPVEYWFNDTSWWKIYSWWATSWFFYTWSVTPIDLSNPLNDSLRPKCIVWDNAFQYLYIWANDYCKTPVNNLWSTTNNSWICPKWYHVPSSSEWKDSIQIIIWDTKSQYTNSSISQIWRNNSKKLKKILRLPFNWTYTLGSFKWKWWNWSYWTSTLTKELDRAIILWFDWGWNFFLPWWKEVDSRSKLQWASLRCIIN